MNPSALTFAVAVAAVAPLIAKSNSFPPGQCTWYAAERFNAVAPEPGVNWGGDAGKWFGNAADKGWEIRTAPASAVAGAVAVWAGGYQNQGHVAFVTPVAADQGSLKVAEMNWAKSGALTDSLVHALPAGLKRAEKDGTPYWLLGFICPRYPGKMSVRPKP